MHGRMALNNGARHQSLCDVQFVRRPLPAYHGCGSQTEEGERRADSASQMVQHELKGPNHLRPPYIHCESKKNWATFLRPITLEVLNRSLPNWAQITFSSFWISYRNLFESTLENSGVIWRITLTVNKKVIKVMNLQWLRHAVVSAMLLTIALLILSTEEKLWRW